MESNCFFGKWFLVVLIFGATDFLSIKSTSDALSTETCDKICPLSDWLCWFCYGVHGSPPTVYQGSMIEDQELNPRMVDQWLKAPTKQELINMGRMSHYRQEKIVGGLPVTYGEEAPWTVSIKYRSGRKFFTFCGGTLVTDRHVVTAAHCLKEYEPHELFVGVGDWSRHRQDTGEILSAIIKFSIHPDYQSMGFRQDLAVVELAQRIQFDRYKRPAALARKESEWTPDITEFIASGWGSRKEEGRSSSKLMQVSIPYVDFDLCRDIYDRLQLPFAKIIPGMICAGYVKDGERDACQGDSGGPLVTFRRNLINPILLLPYGEHQEIQSAAATEVGDDDYQQPRRLLVKTTKNSPRKVSAIKLEDALNLIERKENAGAMAKTIENVTTEQGGSTGKNNPPESESPQTESDHQITSDQTGEEGGVVDRSDYMYRSFDFKSQEDPDIEDLRKGLDFRGGGLEKLLARLRSGFKEHGNRNIGNRTSSTLGEKGGRESDDFEREDDSGEERSPLSRFLWTPGTAGGSTGVALQSMINAGIEATILNALAHFQEIQLQSQALNQHNLLHNLDFGLLTTTTSEDGKGLRRPFQPIKALQAFYEAFSDYHLLQRDRNAILPITRDEYFYQGVPTLAGVVSWGLGCARANYSGVYTDIRTHRDWIIKEIGGEPQWILI